MITRTNTNNDTIYNKTRITITPITPITETITIRMIMRVIIRMPKTLPKTTTPLGTTKVITTW